MAFPEKSILIVGGGIVGLCLAVVARSRGFAVTLIAREASRDTASGVAAGMIAPALEARGEADPDTLIRLQAAQAAWLDLMPAWPHPLQSLLQRQQAVAHSRFIAADGTATDISGDWLVDATATLNALEDGFLGQGGVILRGSVSGLTAQSAILSDGRDVYAAHVVIASGYASHAFAHMVPSLSVLTPIKGHLLDLPGFGRLDGEGVVRSVRGYLVNYGASAKFGASMEPGREDLAVDPAVVADLVVRAGEMFPDLSLAGAVPRTGIRAGTPDNWPLIGRDVASGVWVATGMRRNGFVFAPFAAGVILDLIAGHERPDARPYDPQRFA
jgi:glycine oxidase